MYFENPTTSYLKIKWNDFEVFQMFLLHGKASVSCTNITYYLILKLFFFASFIGTV